MNILKEKNYFGEIFYKLRKKDFSGNSGRAIKNSIFTFSSTLIAKIGSIIFTIILARLLLPELFGLYSLALSTILIFASFSDLGVSSTLIKFISQSKNPEKSKAYFSYLLKSKILLSVISIFLLLIMAGWISNDYYNKPIFLALVAGSFYIFFSGLIGIYEGLFQSQNNFKKTFYKEIIFQVSRLVLVPLTVLLSINLFSEEKIIALIILALSIAFLSAFFFIFFSAKKKISFLKLKTKKLDNEEKIKLNKFILALSALTLSGVLFGYVDMIVLGRFVDAEFIGYYRAALSLITSAAPLITFSSALFPIFSRLKEKQLKRGLRKTVLLTLIIAIFAFIFTLIFSPLIVGIIFGPEYFLSSEILRIFSVLIIVLPLISLYSSYFISQDKPKKVLLSLLIATALNIILNITFILYLLPYGQLQAVYGVASATIISQFVYLISLVWKKD